MMILRFKTPSWRRNILPAGRCILYLLYISMLLIVPSACSSGHSKQASQSTFDHSTDSKASSFPSLEYGDGENQRLRKAATGSSHLIVNRFANDLVRGANKPEKTTSEDGHPVTPFKPESMSNSASSTSTNQIAQTGPSYDPSAGSLPLDDAGLIELQSARARQAPVRCVARVYKLMKEDTRGRRHQRFLLKLSNGTTVLVAHNIDLAPRVPLRVGDVVEIQGEYIWNERGGVLHYTHRSTSRRKPGGWIKFNGRTFN